VTRWPLPTARALLLLLTSGSIMSSLHVTESFDTPRCGQTPNSQTNEVAVVGKLPESVVCRSEVKGPESGVESVDHVTRVAGS
jgi:hypothetical protein